jgi:hypothetical protein
MLQEVQITAPGQRLVGYRSWKINASTEVKEIGKEILHLLRGDGGRNH